METKPRVVLIDLSSIWWTAYMVNSENAPQQARSITLANVKRCIGEGNPLVAICCDSGRSFRKDISPDYKSNREKQPEMAYGELTKTKDRLRADGYLLWESDGFEADDVIAIACDKAVSAGHEVRIASADKDMFQLIGPHVDCLRTNTWEVWTAATVEEKLKIKPVQMVDFLALQGDSSDNVPGCQGIGKVRAAELLQKYGTVGKIYAALDRGETVATPANQKALTEHRAAVELSRQLVQMSYEAPIDFNEIYAERKVTSLTEKSESLPEDGDPTDATNATAPENSPTQHSDVAVAPVNSESSGERASVALVPVEYERQLEPRSLRAAVWLGQHLYDSRLYTRYPNAEAITAVIIRGRELGLGALTALDSFHIMEGRPVPHAYLMIARAKEHPDCEYLYCEMETSNHESATWITKSRRNPKEQKFTYTIAMARASGLVQPAQEKTGRDGKKYMSKDNQWVVRPAEMLRKTAGVQLARAEYPAATMGLYAWEELGGDE